MSRIRTIKPEFFTSEDITSLTPLARLFYIALWCESDREGRLEWKPGTFKLRYFPADICDLKALATELVDHGLVVLYKVDDKTFADIPTFKEHQVINNRETPSTIPARVTVASGRVKAEGKEGRKGREGNSTEPLDDSAPALAAKPSVVAIPLIDKTEYPITQSMVDEWSISYPAVNVLQELREMRSWSYANPTNQKTARGVPAFVIRWLGREQDKGRGRPGPSAGGVLPGAI